MRPDTLLDRYLLDLDERELDDEWARSLFTEDTRVQFPMSAHEGIDGLAAWHAAALARFARTQHFGSPVVVQLVGHDRASLRCNVVSAHVHFSDELFVAGTFVTGEARRTGSGWRLARLAFRVVWTTGSPP